MKIKERLGRKTRKEEDNDALASKMKDKNSNDLTEKRPRTTRGGVNGTMCIVSERQRVGFRRSLILLDRNQGRQKTRSLLLYFLIKVKFKRILTLLLHHKWYLDNMPGKDKVPLDENSSIVIYTENSGFVRLQG